MCIILSRVYHGYMKRLALALIAAPLSVAAFVPACRVTVAWEYRVASKAAHRHHSAETLARWKVGAAKWSLAHGGKVYRGVPVRHFDWVPTAMPCGDVPTVPSELEGLFPRMDAPDLAYGRELPMEAPVPIPSPDTPVTPSQAPVGVASAFPVGFPPVGSPLFPVCPVPEPGTWLMVGTGLVLLVQTLKGSDLR